MTAFKMGNLTLLLTLFLLISCSEDPAITGVDNNSEVPIGEMKSAQNHPQNSGELVQELTAPDATADARFGTSLAADKQTAVIGAPFHSDGSGGNNGAVYIFRKQGNQWEFETKLQPDVESFSTFGRQVAISGGVIAVTGGNTVYVFEQRGQVWSMSSILEPEEPHPGDSYGAALAVDGKTIAVGDPDHRDIGSVHIYEQQGSQWQFAERVSASDGAIADRFGESVSLSGNTLISGSTRLNAAYLFERKGNSWNETAVIEPDHSLPTGFGFSVAHDGKTAVIGSPLNDGGVAYLFEKSKNRWIQTEKLSDPTGGEEDRLGQSVAVGKKLIAVGAPGLISAPGSVYYTVSQGGNWSDLMSLDAGSVQEGDRLGFSVAVSTNMVLAGAPGDDGETPDAGKVYVFE